MADASLHPIPLYRQIYSQIINLLVSCTKNYQIQEDSLVIFTLHVDHLRATSSSVRRSDIIVVVVVIAAQVGSSE